MTGGAFSAATSGERAARIREWLTRNPSAEQMQDVFKELSGKDKGAAKPLREKLDELKRAKGQEAIAAEWADKATALLALTKLNIADALAWQRDAAKAGAALSKEPLAALKVQLSERVKAVEDLQHRAQVQREAAMMMAQRVEVLSTKPWRDAQAAWEPLRTDVTSWQTLADALAGDAAWVSVDAKFGTQIDTARSQLFAVWEAFQAAMAQTVAASGDAAAPLPAVPVWAEEIRQARNAANPQATPDRPARPKVDPEVRAKSTAVVRELLAKLEHELAEGHGKASLGAANDVRAALKEHGANIGDKLDMAAQHALGAAGELEGWQRWRANQIRDELTTRAVALVKEPLGGRKQQEAVRALRDAWKQTDQGGAPNHAMWKRFDDACNEAYKLVEAWLDKVKAEEGANKAQRLDLIERVKIWTEANKTRTDWKEINRILHNMSEDWRNGGHIGEKTYAELQPLWKEAIKGAHASIDAAQKTSLTLRYAMIEEAKALGAMANLRIDAVRALQQRWQAEAQSVPIDRKQEQKLWDAFRKPIDDAFNAKSAQREAEQSARRDALSALDRGVLDAVAALDAANASGDAQKIKAAIANLEAASRGQAVAKEAAKVAEKAEIIEKQADVSVISSSDAIEKEVAAAVDAATNAPADAPADAAAQDVAAAQSSSAQTTAAAQLGADATDAATATDTAPDVAPAAEPVAVAAPAKVAKPVVAMRGDDRPGVKKIDAPQGRFADKRGGAGAGAGRFGDRAGSGAGAGRPGAPAGRAGERGNDRGGERGGERGGDRGGDRGFGRNNERSEAFEDRGPRLSNDAFYAQRDALERAQTSLKKLAAQAHGESLTALLSAWEQRQGDAMPSAQELGKSVSPAARTAWSAAVAKPAVQKAERGDAATALLRLEMAAEVPTPAEHISARRMLQLQLLTKRNDPGPVDTWALDTTAVLSTPHDAASARRLQTALKALLR